MSPFPSYKSQQRYFATKKSPPQSPPQPPMGIYKNPVLKTHISDALIWTGCSLAFSKECLVIKGVYTVYKTYKQGAPNNQFDANIKRIVKRGVSKIITTVTENEIHTVSEKIVNQVNDSGLINNISEKTNINENIIRDFMGGTASNLLKDKIEYGTGFLVNNVVL